jgi:hypothetical protein
MRDKSKEDPECASDKILPPRHRIRLPGFLIEEEIGLGDALKRTTYAVGIKPCSGCDKRANALNRWMVFSR